MSKISMIAAMSYEGVIGYKNSMPWNLKSDMEYFKKLTIGKTIVMGRKTYDSIGKILEGRKNIVVSKDKNLKINGAKVIDDLSEMEKEDEYFVIGGKTLYDYFIDKADILYLTLVDHKFIGDTFFPKILLNNWKIISYKKCLEEKKHNIYFVVLKKYS